MNQFSAVESALGAQFQYRYGLLELLKVARTSPDFGVTIEQVEDVAVVNDGNIISAAQTKLHSTGGGALTDKSVDLWKTLRIWCTGVLDGTFTLPEQRFFLVTTGNVPAESAASYLRYTDRDVAQALKLLDEARRTSKNRDNLAGYEAFESLSSVQKELLLECMYVVDDAGTLPDIDAKITDLVAYAAPRTKIIQFVERLTGWWLYRVVAHLQAGPKDVITATELDGKIEDLREQFLRTNLPIDDEYSHPDENQLDPESSDQAYVAQLRLIALNNDRIRLAMRDYYRAFMQRSRWIRDELLHLSELQAYERKLRDEWDRHFRIARSRLVEPITEDALISAGEALYSKFETDYNQPIRKDCTDPFVCRGTYQILANEQHVGWHPEFVERLKQVISIDQAVA